MRLAAPPILVERFELAVGVLSEELEQTEGTRRLSLSDLALVSRAAKGSLLPQRAPIAPRDVVTPFAEAVRPTAAAQKVVLEVYLAQELLTVERPRVRKCCTTSVPAARRPRPHRQTLVL